MPTPLDPVILLLEIYLEIQSKLGLQRKHFYSTNETLETVYVYCCENSEASCRTSAGRITVCASQPGIHHIVLGLLLLYLPFLILHQCFLTGGCRPFGWDLLHCTGIAEP